jgi:hypothetical protein
MNGNSHLASIAMLDLVELDLQRSSSTSIHTSEELREGTNIFFENRKQREG